MLIILMSIALRRLSVCVMALCLVACTVGSQAQSELAFVSETEPTTESAAQEQRSIINPGSADSIIQNTNNELNAQTPPPQIQIPWLLENAQLALQKGNLMLPSADNAFSWYRQVLVIDHRNTAAHSGMQQITKRYLVLAQAAFTEGDPDRAESMLKRALSVSATPAQVNSVRQRFKREQVANNEFRLSRSDLTARNNKLIAYLDSVARKAKELDSRLLIVARTDAEGRWIYQQMRMAVNGYRLRGNIKIGRTPAVKLIDMDS